MDINEFNKYFQQIDNETFEKRFTLCEELGRGSGSTVSKAKDNNRQHGQVAIKLYNKQQLKQHTRIDVIREIQLLLQIKRKNFSQHFVNLIHAFKIVQENSYKTQYCLVMDLCDLSLEQLVKNKQELLNLPEIERIKICLKIAKGVECLHSMNLLHRDLKPDNILLKKTSESYEPLISDFGHSKENKMFMTSLRGTPLYVDPALQYTQNYGFQWDIFSLGLIFLKVMSGEYIIRLPEPLPSKSNFNLMLENALKNIKNCLRIFDFNEKVKDVIEKCLIKKRCQIFKIVESLQAIMNQIFEQYKISQQLTFQSVGESENQASIMFVRTESIMESSQVESQSSNIKNKPQSQFKQSNPQSLIMTKKVISSKFKSQNILESDIVSSENYSSRVKSTIKKQPQSKLKPQQNIKTEQIKKIESKKEKKSSKFSKNKKEMIGKMFSLRNTTSQNLYGFNTKVQKLEVIKKYEEKLKKIYLIEQSSIRRQVKNKLITLAFIYLKMIIKQNLKEMKYDEFLIKQIGSFNDKVETLFEPLLKFMKQNQFQMSKDARCLLWGQDNMDSNYVKKQFYQIIKNQCPHQKSTLQRFIL